MLKILIDAQGLRLIIGERSENICSSSECSGVGAQGKRKRQDETRFTTNIVGKKN
jgi:hypothetical protein